ncbi:PREDICTED: gibberellin-regulated protein 11-like [Camelina sativa]|uniref:Gibberellin-regulated protein 11-like n=1 Tax=Camelina sativa TaxID=90675 RepID=A0ABM0W9K0_CAMSA|nr:PREDICTED: gibberellin-regulated protein 11-like [Camelina sativa]
MDIFKVVLASLLISLLVLDLVHGDMVTSNNNGATIDCNSRCQERCRLSSRQNLCHRACGTCCARCNCVPSGTYGNYDQCECYGSLTTHGGRRKCP